MDDTSRLLKRSVRCCDCEYDEYCCVAQQFYRNLKTKIKVPSRVSNEGYGNVGLHNLVHDVIESLTIA